MEVYSFLMNFDLRDFDVDFERDRFHGLALREKNILSGEKFEIYLSRGVLAVQGGSSRGLRSRFGGVIEEEKLVPAENDISFGRKTVPLFYLLEVLFSEPLERLDFVPHCRDPEFGKYPPLGFSRHWQAYSKAREQSRFGKPLLEHPKTRERLLRGDIDVEKFLGKDLASRLYR